MRVKGERILQELNRFAAIGKTSDGGVDRPGFSGLERQANALMGALLADCGFTQRFDAAGSLIARREGTDVKLGAIIIASHLDTVPNGGRFDGALGVIAGLEVARVLVEENIRTRHALEIISFADEESSRFGLGLVGSKIMTGRLNIDKFLALQDKSGATAEQALAKLGADAAALAAAQRDLSQVAGYLELHIEQGRVLESEQKKVGIVTAIAAPTRFSVRVEGSADHSGATPMRLRRDALAAAAAMILAVEEAAKASASGTTVATVGTLSLKPGVMNVVPGEVEFAVDIRDVNGAAKRDAAAAITNAIAAIAEKRGVSAQISFIDEQQPILLAKSVIDAIEENARKLGIDAMRMPSGAGHDSMNFAPAVPTGMIFVPSREGKSHSPQEYTAIEDIVPGVELLLETLLALDARLP